MSLRELEQIDLLAVEKKQDMFILLLLMKRIGQTKKNTYLY